MHLTQRILGFTLLGSEWVLWVLLALSVLSVAVMVERAIAFAGTGGNLETLGREVVGRLLAGDRAAARQALEGRRAPGRSSARRRATSSRPSASTSPRVPAKARARSTITATDSTDRAISTQRTHSEPSSVKPRIRWVRCMAFRDRRPRKTLSQSPRYRVSGVGLRPTELVAGGAGPF
jgi:hypothetical protein